ncbi:MFS transporter [Microbispora corallina]|uniref:MFS transporter n=1 Tax=Microbispora corallina TaxID=83302 RepID=UPI0031D8B68B
MHDTTSAVAGPRAGRREWIGLAVLALPTLLVSIDVYVMLLALPYLSTDLGAGGTQQLWIIDIYGFMLSGFLVTMGTLGDRIGRRRLLLIGASAFAVASVVSAYSRSPEMLIAARGVLGVAGATLAPSTLSLITTLFRDARQRGTAIGIWAMCFSAGAIIGPLVGGAMLEHFWWGSVFLLGVPAMVLLLVLGPVLLPEYRDAGAGRLDLASVALSMAAILPIIYGLKELAKSGWSAGALSAIVVGLALGVVFVRRQRALASPLLDVRLFAHRSFSAALVSILFGTLLMGAIMMFITQHFELVQGLSPLQAGVWMLPAVAANTVSFMVSPMLARRFRPAYCIGGGLAISVAGLVVITQVQTASAPGLLASGFALIFLGAGPLVTLGTGLVIGSAPQEKAGSAAAINETSGQFGFALGIAALGSIGAAVYRATIAVPDGVPAAAARAARESITGAASAAAGLPAQAGEALLAPARDAYTSGLNVVAAVSAVLLAAVAVLAATRLRHVPPTGRAEQDEQAAADEPALQTAG